MFDDFDLGSQVEEFYDDTGYWEAMMNKEVSLYSVSKKKKTAVGKLPVFRMHLSFARNFGIPSTIPRR